MIEYFNEKEKKKMEDFLDGLDWDNEYEVTYGDIKRTVIYDSDLARKIIYGKVNVKEITQKEYDNLLFALESTHDFYLLATGEEEQMLKKFLHLIKESRA